MKSILKKSLFFAILVFITSCTTISYVPRVSLDVSPKSINKSVQIDKLKDSSPIDGKYNPFGGSSVTHPNAISNELDVEVTNAIVNDFSTNGVFKHVSRKIDNPDYTIKGEIIKFYGKSGLTDNAKIFIGLAMVSAIAAPMTSNPVVLFGALPLYTLYFGFPAYQNMTEIELVFKLYDKNNTLVGTYTGKAYDNNVTSIYHNIMFALPTLTNKTLSSAVMQIREQILNDISKLEK